MSDRPFLSLAALVLLGACATPYAYRFEPGASALPEDGDINVRADVDANGAREIVLAVTNKTGETLQVGWARIAMLGPDGKRTTLRPDTDLGWVEPGSTQTAHLSPFTLPAAGDAALAYDGQRFELQVPMTVRHEPRLYRLPLSAHVHPL